MFAYCNNNPVNFTDQSGTIPSGDNPWSKAFHDFFVGIGFGLVEDIVNYSKNNNDVDKVYKSNYFSSYKGTLVIRHSNSFLTSWAFGTVIFLNHDNDKYETQYKSEVLNHEKGHILQEEALGTGTYLVAVAIPSMIVNLLAREEGSFFEKNYYNMPWERNADERGGVTRNYSSWADSLASLWFAFWEG